jgi:AraC-like DNA-binding protein
MRIAPMARRCVSNPAIRLDNTRMSVEAVAEALGFAETASFSRAFKRWKGVSPLRFRRSRGAM